MKLENLVEYVINGYFFILLIDINFALRENQELIIRAKLKKVLVHYININEERKLVNGVTVYNNNFEVNK